MKTFECIITVTAKNEEMADKKSSKLIPTPCVCPEKWSKYEFNYQTTMEFETEELLYNFFRKIKDIDLFHEEEI
jgi:hypothetical protein